MRERGNEFADIAYTIMVVEKAPSIELAAATLGMSYAVLHARLTNRTCFSADEIRDLIRAIPDPRLVSYLLKGTKFVAAERQDGDEQALAREPSCAIQRAATRVVVEATDVLEIVDASLAGKRLDRRRGKLVLREIDEAERALASLRLRIETL